MTAPGLSCSMTLKDKFGRGGSSPPIAHGWRSPIGVHEQARLSVNDDENSLSLTAGITERVGDRIQWLMALDRPFAFLLRTSLHGCFGRASRRVREAAPAKPAPIAQMAKQGSRNDRSLRVCRSLAWCHQRRTASGWQAQPRTDQRGCPVRVLRRKTQRVMTCSQAIDMQGKRFERLLVVCRAGTDRCGNATWVCRCVCSTETIVTGANLRNGSTRSCGCLNRDLTIERNKGFVRHGHARRSKKTCEYTSLQNALYGKRATVCKRWRESFCFLSRHGSQAVASAQAQKTGHLQGVHTG